MLKVSQFHMSMSGGLSLPTKWNSADKTAGITLSGDDLIAAGDNSAIQNGVRSVKSVSAGKWYWETKPTAFSSGCFVGIMKAGAAYYVGSNSNGWGFYSTPGDVYNNAVVIFNGPPYLVNDVIGNVFDADAGKLYFHVNGTYINSGDPVAGTGAVATGLTSGPYFAACSDASNGADTFTLEANFGATPLIYPVPAGFNPGLGDV